MLFEFTQLPEAGSTLGVYELQELVSTSIFGGFYHARQRLTEETCLLMVLPEAITLADAQFHERLQRVAEEQKQLPEGSPVLPIREITQAGGYLLVQYAADRFVAMTRFVLAGDAPLAEAELTAYFKRMVTGLSDAAKLGHGHYFLTPDFVFLNGANELFIAGVGIFQSISYEGFERYISGAVNPVAPSDSKNFGALEILCPEIRNFKKPDPRSDFYCFGMCGYFMLAGQKPQRDFILPSALRPGFSEGWDFIFSRCLEKNPAARYPQFAALLGDLEGVQSLRGQGAGPRKGHERLLLSRIPLPKRLESRLSARGQNGARVGLLAGGGLLLLGTVYLLLTLLFADSGVGNDPPPVVRQAVVEAAPAVFSPVFGYLLLTGLPGSTVHLQVAAPAPTEVDVASAAEVDVLLLWLGQLSESGDLALQQRLLQDRHTLLVRHPHAQPLLVTVDLAADPVRLHLAQVMLTGRLSMEAQPAARVFLNDAEIGQTPLDQVEITGHGVMDLRLEADGYVPYRSEVEILPGQTLIYPSPVLLQPRTGTVRWEIDWPESAQPDLKLMELEIAGRAVALDAEANRTLPIGEHTIRIEHPDYLPVRTNFTVAEGRTTLLKIPLVPKPAQLRIVLPDSIPVMVRRNEQDFTLPDDGVVALPPFTRHRFEVAVRDFMTVARTFELQPNESVEWTIPLEPLPGPQQGETWVVPYLGMQMLWVEPGSFMLGSPVREFRRNVNEDTMTYVRITRAFWAGAHEVTQAAFQRVMGFNPSAFPGTDRPVESVSWLQAVQFAERLTAYEASVGRLPEGFVYRLPTEAEWEFFARAGTSSPFSFGDSASPEFGNFSGVYRMEVDASILLGAHQNTVPVGSYAPNPWGFFDVHGNVAEWVADRFWDRHPGASAVNPFNNARGRGRVVKGGSWRDSADAVRSASREGVPENRGRNSIGFRIILAPPLSD